jgi:ribosomal protein L7/L12
MITDTEFYALKSRVTALEEQIAFLYQHLHLQIGQDPTELDRQLADILRRGDKIGAIKVYREATDTDLSSAKTYVEELAKRLSPFSY